MSIEKMIMLNMVGHIDDLESICKSAVLSGSLQPVNALHEINSTDFTLSATEDNLEALIDVCYIRPYVNKREYNSVNRSLAKLKDICGHNKNYPVFGYSELILDFEEINCKINILQELILGISDRLENIRRKEEELSSAVEHLKFIRGLAIPLMEMENLKNLAFELFRVSKENMIKLKHNYENVPAIIISVYKDVEYEIIMCFTPNILKTEADRIFKSLNCEAVSLPDEYEGTPGEITSALNDALLKVRSERKELEKALKNLVKENEKQILILDKSLELEMKSSELKTYIACTHEFFYLCGWIPWSLLKDFKIMMSGYEDRLIIIEKKAEDINPNIIPPSRLKNNFIVQPFESMVRMYGIPSYGELDPTAFLGFSYMMMFGAMFGDVGQGLVFFLAGMFIKYIKHNDNFGGVLARLGISSSIFGFLYGSIFGFENIIEPLFIRPMEEISHVLVYAVVFGCCLMIIGFIYNLLNSIKRKDVENGVFGKDGITGLTFYLSIIIYAVSRYRGVETLPSSVWITIFLILITLMLLKEPLANLILNKRPLYSESKKDYFVEGGFGVFETLLSMFSNTLSFIRIGAFALNHVGLFLAFSALAKMMNNSTESLLMYILGNTVIIGLEGLIVFIQGLRLEYYELFSKYYDGSGTLFEPLRIIDDNRRGDLKTSLKVYKNIVRNE